ncbi:hypothetical protein BDCR2A_01421 [Borrelia duttonii CR2A]|uniref:Uncharacterized protein n=1 Tax=Borrelia duttonii CR2A TaxID=1432657 RepID=W6TK99_9SPIR|nr:hypothetical protein BDCR2A_01421 [Borrelia duttonii CR2A]
MLMILNNILNKNITRLFYYINRNFTKIVSKVYSLKIMVYKKITPTAKLVKSEIFIYNKTHEYPKLLLKKENLNFG